MKTRRYFPLVGSSLLAGLLLLCLAALLNQPAARANEDVDLSLISEMTGYVASDVDLGQGCNFNTEYNVYLCVEAEPAALPQPNAAARAQALQMLVTEGLLLVPESTNDRVMAFDPTDGTLIDANFIPADPDNLSTPIHAVVSPNGDSILVSDQIDDVVQEYDLAGNYVGVFAPIGGANTAILDNIRGIAVTSDGRVLVTVGGGANDDAIVAFDSDGTHLGNFVANGAGGLDSPFDVLERSTDFLVGGISSDAIHRYDSAGAPIADLTAIDTFPEQLAELANGNILVANFSGIEEGVVEYDSSGSQIGIYDPASLGGYRGAYELGNGSILTSNGSGVHEIDRSANVIDTEIDSVSGRFIQHVQAGMVVTQTVQAGTSGCGTSQNVSVNPGDMVTFCYTLTNVGQFQWQTHTITDTVNGAVVSGLTNVVTPGLSVSIEQSYMVPASATTAISNCADWTASNSAFSLTEQSCVTVDVDGPTDVQLAAFNGNAGLSAALVALYAALAGAGVLLFVYLRRQRTILSRVRQDR